MDTHGGSLERQEIADLQRQLQQAQEDLKCEQDAHRAHLNSLARAEEERDAAIERAEAAEALADKLAWALQRMKPKTKPFTMQRRIVKKALALYFTAEALRAEHRSDRDRTPSTESPQSGQARQEDSGGA